MNNHLFGTFYPESDKIDKALEGVFLKSLRPVSLGLGFLYLLFTVSHFFVLPDVAVVPMVLIASITSITFLFIGWMIRQTDITKTGMYIVGTGIVILLLINTLYHLYLLEDINQTTNIIIILIGQGFFLLSTPWYYVTMFITILSWSGVVLSVSPVQTEQDLIHYSFALASGVLLSVLLHHLRRNNLISVFTSQFAEEKHKEDLREALDELKKLEARSSAMVEAAFEGIVFSTDNQIMDMNQNTCDMFGVAADHMKGQSVLDFIDPEFQERVRQNLESGYDKPYEAVGMKGDGSTFPLEIRGKVIDYQDQRIRVTAVRDLTNQRRIEDDLRKLSRAIEQSKSVVLITDTEARIEYVNPAFTKLTGYTFEEVQGNNPRILKSGETPQEVYDELWSTLKSGGTWRGEFMNEKKNGETFWEAATITPVRDANGEITHYIAIKEDITALKETNMRLQEAKEEAEQASRTKSEFLANMSHELRTPLNSVIGFSNVLLKNKGDTLTAQQLSYLERIRDNGTHLLELINDVLDLSKIEAHRMTVEKTQVNLRELIEDVAKQMDGQIQSENLRMETAVPDGVQVIETDARKVRQILINLVGNAIKFTDTGYVKITLEVDENAWPQRIKVKDTGIGIPEEKKENIFEAFQQIDSSTSRTYQGTGLGLAITASLCELLEYEIKLESTVGEGTTFTIDLDTGQKKEEEPAIGSESYSDRFSEYEPEKEDEKVVLIIDDDPDSQILLGNYTEELCCRVVSAPNGTQGLELAKTVKPDLILLDLVMDGMSGFDVLKQLQMHPTLKNTPVIVTSIIGSENRSNLVGAMEVLDKPIQRQELRGILRKYLDTAKSRVLIVDDDKDTRDLLVDFLRDEPFEVITAENGAIAAQKLEAIPVDLILLDLVMPVKDGLSFLEEIRQNLKYENLPVIVITGKDLSTKELEQLHYYSASFIKKSPSLYNRLKEMVNETLHRVNSAGDDKPDH